MRFTAARIATAVFVVSLCLPAAAGATFPGRNGRIFFSAPSRGEIATGCGVASVNANGTAYNCVDYFRRDAAVSPDHRRIAAVEGDIAVDVFGMNINGTGVRRFTRTTDGHTNNLSPTYTPDGRHIVFTKFQSSADGLYEMNSDGSGQHLLLTPGQDGVFSPSGAQIAYDIDGIRVADAGGGGTRLLVANRRDRSASGLTLTTYLEYNREPNWSPNGRQIVFSRESHLTVVTCTLSATCAQPQRQDATDVYVMNADGGGLRRLTSTSGFDEEDPHFSPDGSQIAYYKQDARLDQQSGQIWVMRADGTGQHQIANGGNPEWTSVQGGPSKPRLQFKLQKINRRSKCLGRLDGFVATVLTDASRKTSFDVTMFADGKLLRQEFNTRGFGQGADQFFHRGRHRIHVTVDDAATHDHISRTFTVRRC
jgi:tricorn protease-like protein